MNICLFCFPFLCMFSLALIFCACVIMMAKYDGTDWDKKIWIGSKILTLKKLLDKNNNYTYPILSIGREGNIISYNKNYESLLKDSNKDCEKNNYKKCGILDTLGNIMCIPKEDTCPINSIIVDLKSKENEYVNNGYKVGSIKDLSNDYYVYYTNDKTDNNIVAKIKISETIPKYISSENLIFDEDSFDDYTTQQSDDDNDGYDYDDDDDYDDYHSFKVINRTKRKRRNSKNKILRKLLNYYGDSYTDSYIKERFNDEINIDKTYKLISNNLYVGNYLGFHDYNNMKNFSTFDLYDTYFTVFPNKATNVFCYICSILYAIAIIFYICLVCSIKELEERVYPMYLAIIPYFLFFIGFFSYTLYEFFNIYKNKRPFELSNIKADPFIEDLLKEIQGRHCEEIYLIIVIILLPSSLGIFIIGFIVYCRCKQMTSSIIEKNTQKTELLG